MEQARQRFVGSVTVRQFGNKYRLCVTPYISRKGYSEEVPEQSEVNDEKLANNLYRARARVWELAMCNDWDYFVTMTIDSEKADRYVLEEYQKELSTWMKNQRQRKTPTLRYLLIPETHKDEAWHVHGLIKGDIETAEFGTNAPQKLRTEGFLDWPAYRARFGWCSLGKIKDHDRVATYIAKYVTKSMLAGRQVDVGKHLYYSSNGLERSTVIYKSECLSMDPRKAYGEPNYEGEYCHIWQMDRPPVDLMSADATAAKTMAAVHGEGWQERMAGGGQNEC